ncbi:hypothetical protein ACQEVS_32910 [Streptomyces sp. CA-181903]|uniref:hypothetical protein n=1 Tax=Streptomyces sp. CA-181903 TaxID=3240055 RepID=UPI003D8E4A3C
MNTDDNTADALSGRTRALLDLGGWPVRRDRLAAERVALVVAAWQAGARNVAELARAADVSRDVIYDDLRRSGINPSDPQTKKESVMPATTQQVSARRRLLQQVKTLLDSDRGLGALVEFNGRPDLGDTEKAVQMAWSRALVALHGRDRAARVYSGYARDRQRDVARSGLTLTSWDSLVLDTKPVGDWTRDIHGFLCVVCGGTFPSVLIEGLDPACQRCARENTESPEEAAPLWRAYSHHAFVFPGALREELPKGESTVTVRFDTEEHREYTTGDVGLFFSDVTSLPGYVQHSTQVFGENRDAPTAVIEAHTEHDGRGFDITATFTYDPLPEAGEPHPYGFRFTAARLTPTHPAPGAPAEYTDVYAMLDALINGLHGDAGTTTK